MRWKARHRCALSFVAQALAVIIVSMCYYSKGPSSHSGFAGAATTGIATSVGIWAFLTCPRHPMHFKLLALAFASLSIALSVDTIGRYVLFGVK